METNFKQPVRRPKVSVVLATYNRADFLIEAIESVRAQTFKDWELIIVDDGSRDKTGKVVSHFRKQDDRIRYVNDGHQGLSRARGRGTLLATGDYITFLDDDDLFLPEKMEKQVAYLESRPEVGLVYSYVKMVNREKKYLRRWPTRPAENFRELIRQCTIQPNAVLIRRQCFEHLGVFRTAFGGSDDYDMWLRIARAYPIAFLPENVGLYRWHADNASHNYQRRLENLLLVYKELGTWELTQPEKKELLRTVLFMTYYKALEELHRRNYEGAAYHFYKAVCFSPKIGTMITWSRYKNPVYRFLKPYMAMFYCRIRSRFHKRKLTGVQYG